jgi:hypothetical protein
MGLVVGDFLSIWHKAEFKPQNYQKTKPTKTHALKLKQIP